MEWVSDCRDSQALVGGTAHHPLILFDRCMGEHRENTGGGETLWIADRLERIIARPHHTHQRLYNSPLFSLSPLQFVKHVYKSHIKISPCFRAWATLSLEESCSFALICLADRALGRSEAGRWHVVILSRPIPRNIRTHIYMYVCISRKALSSMKLAYMCIYSASSSV